MNTYFFKNVPKAQRAAFRNSYAFQNLKAVQIVSIIFFVLNLLLRLFTIFIPESLTHAANYPEFSFTNWLYLIVTPMFYLTTMLQVNSYRKKHKATGLTTAIVILFSLFLLFSGIMGSFIAMYDPRSNLTLYLVALITVAVTFIMEVEDTIMMTIVAELIFTLILFLSRADPTDVLYNQLTSIIVLTGFYFMSRYFYSYRANHFLQLNEIQRKNIEIEKASDFKNDVLGIVAHDLRNPIAAIESIAMVMELDKLDAETEESLSMIKASCLKARSIVNDLLETARHEGDSHLELHPVILNDSLKNIVNAWTNLTTTQSRIVLSATPQPINVLLNTDKFNRVLDNLISNALKFSKAGDQLDIILTETNGKAQIRVQDYGVGIPAYMLPLIFERFTKAGRSGLNGEKSTGLGLSIAKQIIEKHDGSLKVESEEGRGSTFIIEIPVLS
ncbi:signal transduction histidine kinase [Mucilaginibacter yixingensis]|uniref:histidine kinase n=1 Tax=Mucilaginibacter yixingensis TaxID=1295612 RepID=A0A2T5JAC3_9SPHI|nr:HAMP domain-containing sensor histidine kinase [Mucilaginibacter yixingensis]PTQ97022.1 signal transduction histidine kinase [Mucilaginibacter yixingensis]